MHYLEAWNEALCDGAWGPVGARYGEKLRQGLDLEHWAAFGESLERMMGIVRAVGTGERGEPPASIVALSGDVHHAYLAEVGVPEGHRHALDARGRRRARRSATRSTTRSARSCASWPPRRRA